MWWHLAQRRPRPSIIFVTHWLDLQTHSHVVDVELPLPDLAADSPWLRVAGMWADDPDWDSFQDTIVEYRRGIDAQSATGMSLRYILDTDNVSLLPARQRGDCGTIRCAGSNCRCNHDDYGRRATAGTSHDHPSRANPGRYLRGYERLYETLRFYDSVALVLYDAVAAARFDDMRRQGIRIGTQDLRIAAIVLDAGHNTAHTEYPRFQPDTWADHRRLVASTIAADEL